MRGYPYMNMEVTVKNILSMLENVGFKMREIVKVYHLGVMKLLPLAPASL